MSQIDIAGVLSQIRSLRAQAGGAFGPESISSGALQPGTAGAGAAGIGKASFADAMKSAVGQVNATQQNSQQMQRAFERGEPGVDLASTMVAMQTSRVAFAATVEVRNRLVSAYQDIMNMPI